jgi:hypothetical protein
MGWFFTGLKQGRDLVCSIGARGVGSKAKVVNGQKVNILGALRGKTMDFSKLWAGSPMGLYFVQKTHYFAQFTKIKRLSFTLKQVL